MHMFHRGCMFVSYKFDYLSIPVPCSVVLAMHFWSLSFMMFLAFAIIVNAFTCAFGSTSLPNTGNGCFTLEAKLEGPICGHGQGG